ncbi:hypothetical protein VNO77_34859 [Canavalia gladiata]|uniref:Uncharacterized protein n=1 Tax=Canavalia gladiata TaxID=3824 RepID=A0AAN9KH26_CANGL
MADFASSLSQSHLDDRRMIDERSLDNVALEKGSDRSISGQTCQEESWMDGGPPGEFEKVLRKKFARKDEKYDSMLGDYSNSGPDLQNPRSPSARGDLYEPQSYCNPRSAKVTSYIFILSKEMGPLDGIGAGSRTSIEFEVAQAWRRLGSI